MAERLCQLKKKGGGASGEVIPSEFYINTYESISGGEATGAVIFNYDNVFPKYTKIKYEAVLGTPRTIHIDNLTSQSASPTTFNITTSWQDIPSTIKTGSGLIRFLLTTRTVSQRITAKILLE